MAAGRISAKMPSDFEFAYPFEIQSFAMSIQRGFRVYHYEASDAYLTDEMIEQIKKTNRGQNIVFEAIEAIDPDGLTRRIPPIILSIN